MKYLARIDDITYEIEIMPDGVITVDGEPVEADLLQVDPLGLHSLLINHQSYEIVVEEQQRGYRVTIGSATFTVDVADERQLYGKQPRRCVGRGWRSAYHGADSGPGSEDPGGGGADRGAERSADHSGSDEDGK